jgi:hypothetical protein
MAPSPDGLITTLLQAPAQTSAPLAPWPAREVHDTVSAIVNSPDFARSLGASLAQRAWRALTEFIRELFGVAERIPHGSLIAKVVAILLVAAIVIRVVLARRLRDKQSRIRVARARGGRIVDPWTEAESLAREGNYTEAAHALYAAVLDRLADTERLRLDPAKTSGDYARDLLRRGSRAYSGFRAFSRRFEALIYGAGSLVAGDYYELRRIAEGVVEEKAA